MLLKRSSSMQQYIIFWSYFREQLWRKFFIQSLFLVNF